MAEVRLDPGQQQMGCADRGTLIQQALLEGNIDEAHAQTEYLLGKGYFEPGFIRICRQYDLCQGPG